MVVVYEEFVYFAAAIAASANRGWRVLLPKRLSLLTDSVATRPAHAVVVAARARLVTAVNGELDVETLCVTNGAVAHEGFYKRHTTQPSLFTRSVGERSCENRKEADPQGIFAETCRAPCPGF